jgi:hypothetical protein
MRVRPSIWRMLRRWWQTRRPGIREMWLDVLAGVAVIVVVITLYSLAALW